jgi:NTP pyrophosphatase (non-canonical NTP hydrolase)
VNPAAGRQPDRLRTDPRAPDGGQGPSILPFARAAATVPSLDTHPQLREELMWDQVGRLDAYHGDVPAEVRLLKLTEEVGEVADAFIGMHGLNARKGVCRTRDDLLDVIITAAVAMNGVTGDADEARGHLERRLAAVTERAGL